MLKMVKGDESPLSTIIQKKWFITSYIIPKLISHGISLLDMIIPFQTPPPAPFYPFRHPFLAFQGLCVKENVLVSEGCLNKISQSQWFKTTEICSLSSGG